MKITFHGATKTVTGSKHLITTLSNKKILLDCGMFQGLGQETHQLNAHFGFDPAEIDCVILSHAHIDHSGLLPKLVKEGFSGKIYSSRATYDLCEIMLEDSAHIQIADARFVNKIKEKQGKRLIEPLYDIDDVLATLPLFETVDFGEVFRIDDNITFSLIDNGHILGSAAVHLRVCEDGLETRLTFTGDIGRYNTQLLQDPKSFPQSNIIICESTYGDRLHDNVENAAQDVLNAIIDTCVKKQGRLIIPAFSLGRTQELVYTLNKLNMFGLLPKVRIYVDSPLSVNATEIVRKHKDLLNEDVQKFCETRPDPFGFNQLHYIRSKEESMALNDLKQPCVIISASGMAEAGRVKHHIKYAIGDESNTILLVGYAEPNSLAGKLMRGEKEVTLFGLPYTVKAEVKTVESYSAHADYEEMLQYLSCQDAHKVDEMILVHGEKESLQAWKTHLHGRGFRSITIPDQHETIRFI
ncbi:MAG: MBL fold metallo-hydrolase [Flavobacteriales bacterium]|nr:MBL fold metallo-hydrolase [Flavobacteriales bacterium]MCB9204041.1 MBL fold metallo-hydrolase [Flavobacteriales bacterium]